MITSRVVFLLVCLSALHQYAGMSPQGHQDSQARVGKRSPLRTLAMLLTHNGAAGWHFRVPVTGSGHHIRQPRLRSVVMGNRDESVVFTFGGGAWLHPFYFGVGAALADFSRDRSNPAVRFCGVSVGSIVASRLACQLDLNEAFDIALSTFPRSGRNPFKAVGCTQECIRMHAPSTPTCRLVSEQRRLLIGISKQKSLRKLVPTNIHDFRNKEYAVAVTSASCHLPVLGGVRGILIDGDRYFDGQLTQSWSCLPLFDDVCEDVDCVVRVTAYHDSQFASLRQGWITPQIPLPQSWALLPHSEEALRLLWQLGYLRAVEYLFQSQDAGRLSRYFCAPDEEALKSFAADLQQVVGSVYDKMSDNQGIKLPQFVPIG